MDIYFDQQGNRGEGRGNQDVRTSLLNTQERDLLQDPHHKTVGNDEELDIHDDQEQGDQVRQIYVSTKQHHTKTHVFQGTVHVFERTGRNVNANTRIHDSSKETKNQVEQ